MTQFPGRTPLPYSQVESITSWIGKVYVSTYEGTVYAAEEESVSWSHREDFPDGPISLLAAEQGLFGVQRYLYHSTDGGLGWLVHSSLGWGVQCIIYSPEIPNIRTEVFYVGTNSSGMYYSGNGVSWYSLTTSPRSVYSIVSDSTYIFAASGNSVYRSTDLGQIWQGTDNYFSSMSISGLAYTAGRIYVSTSSHGVYASTNLGMTWYPTGSGLPVMNGSAIVTARGEVFVGTVDKVYRTTDNGFSWHQFRSGLPDAFPIRSLHISKVGILYAGTGGRGVYKTTLEWLVPPLPPESVTAIPYEDSVRLSWLPSSAEDFLEYRVYGGSSSHPKTLIATTSGGREDTSVVIKNLIINSNYYYRVTAVDSLKNESYYSAELKVKTGDYIAPAAPEGLTGVAKNAKVILTWRANIEPDCGKYRIYAGTHPSPTSIVDSIYAGDTTRILTGLKNDSTYYIRITSVDYTGNESSFSNEISLTPVAVFSQIQAGLKGLEWSGAAWGDYDRDGDLDAIITGFANSVDVTTLYRNASGYFTQVQSFDGVKYVSNISWVDYDNDGDLDCFIAGYHNSVSEGRLYVNESNTLVQRNKGIPVTGVRASAWGDYDNDGDLDIVVIGLASGSFFSSIYQNDGGTFVDAQIPFPHYDNAGVAWGDYDNDGDLDLVIAGNAVDLYGRTTKVYKNDQGAFTDIGAPLLGMISGSRGIAWGDYENDGDLDLLVTGESASGYVTKLYRNEGSIFSEAQVQLPGYLNGSVAWGDYNNDGRLDILLAGSTIPGVECMNLYRYDSLDTFTEVDAEFPGVGSTAVWGDYDKDGDLDILASGRGFTDVFRNDTKVPNVKPSSPTSLVTSVSGPDVTLSWNRAIDAMTGSGGLTYNLRVGTQAGGGEIMPAMSLTNGSRLVPISGNVGTDTSWILRGLAPRTYYWSVQAIDNSFAGSPFASGVTPVSVAQLNEIPTVYSLSQNYPNPFNPSTTITFGLPSQSFVSLKVFDLIGREIATLVHEELAAGYHSRHWNAESFSGGVIFIEFPLCHRHSESRPTNRRNASWFFHSNGEIIIAQIKDSGSL